MGFVDDTECYTPGERYVTNIRSVDQFEYIFTKAQIDINDIDGGVPYGSKCRTTNFINYFSVLFTEADNSLKFERSMG